MRRNSSLPLRFGSVIYVYVNSCRQIRRRLLLLASPQRYNPKYGEDFTAKIQQVNIDNQRNGDDGNGATQNELSENINRRNFIDE